MSSTTLINTKHTHRPTRTHTHTHIDVQTERHIHTGIARPHAHAMHVHARTHSSTHARTHTHTKGNHNNRYIMHARPHSQGLVAKPTECLKLSSMLLVGTPLVSVCRVVCIYFRMVRRSFRDVLFAVLTCVSDSCRSILRKIFLTYTDLLKGLYRYIEPKKRNIREYRGIVWKCYRI